jgi:hypothetical protein
MPRALLVFIVNSLLFYTSIAQNRNSRFPSLKFPADTVKQSIEDISKELSLKHPGFYRYTSKEEFKKYIDSVKSTIKDSLSEMESYLKIKPVISKIHCLHTELALPKEFKDYLNEQPNLIPLQVWFAGNRAWVIKNYSGDHSIVAGDEILAINGKPIESIINQLLPLIPSDGYNLTMKYRALYLQFPSWYRILNLSENYLVEFSHGNSKSNIHLVGVKYKDLARDGFLKEPVFPKELEFKIMNGTGYLTIHSFGKTMVEKGKQKFKPFIDETFAYLNTNHIQNLVVDLRDNTGGSDPYAAYFTSYFFDKPFRYWDHIEVTEAIAKQIKGIAIKAFYRVPIRKDSVWIWLKGKHTDEFDFYEEQQPAKNNFSGMTYVLINGFCMSSCADVVAVLSYHKKATFIGEETGGAYQGNNSGMIPDMKITPFDFTLSVPLQAYFNFVDYSKNRTSGTKPDYPVNPTIEDLIIGKDQSLEKANDLITLRRNKIF